jgi:hypothetical protein
LQFHFEIIHIEIGSMKFYSDLEHLERSPLEVFCKGSLSVRFKTTLLDPYGTLEEA